MTDFVWHAKIIEEALLGDIEDAKWKYKNFIIIKDEHFHEIKNWFYGDLTYNKDYEYFIDYDNNHYIFFKEFKNLTWFLLSNNLTNYTVHIE